MKVSQAIRILTHNYQPNDDIIANWWGYELYNEDINEELWAEVVELVEEGKDGVCKLDYYEEQIHDTIYQSIQEVKGEI